MVRIDAYRRRKQLQDYELLFGLSSSLTVLTPPPPPPPPPYHHHHHHHTTTTTITTIPPPNHHQTTTITIPPPPPPPYHHHHNHQHHTTTTNTATKICSSHSAMTAAGTHKRMYNRRLQLQFLSSWWWAVCHSKHVEQLRYIGIINSTTRSHLVGYFYTI